MHQAIDPVSEARNDFDIFRDLARRLGCEDAFAEGRDETAWLRHLYDAFRDRAQSNLVRLFGCLAALGMTRRAMPTMRPARMATRMY